MIFPATYAERIRIKSQKYLFASFGVETLDPCGLSALSLYKNIF